jgi:hypothetical protein
MTGQQIIVQKPQAALDLSGFAYQALRRAGAVGVLPTPLDDLIAAARLGIAEDPQPLIRKFLGLLGGAARDTFLTAIQKVRGIADLREHAIYVPSDGRPARVKWAKAHELGHQEIPWHQVNAGYADDERSLTTDAQELFDQEANFFASEIIFQGRRFQRIARDYSPSLDAVFQLADDHGASRQATLWRFVEDHDEPVAAVMYWPSRYALDDSGESALTRGKIVVASPAYSSKYADIELPVSLGATHPWAEARRTRDRIEGEISLSVGSSLVTFEWHAWWNTYCLMVLIRRRPLVRLIGDVFSR